MKLVNEEKQRLVLENSVLRQMLQVRYQLGAESIEFLQCVSFRFLGHAWTNAARTETHTESRTHSHICMFVDPSTHSHTLNQTHMFV